MRTTIVGLTIAAALLIGATPLATAAAPNVVHLGAPASGLRYTNKVAHAHAGKIKIIFTNASTALKHNVNVEKGETELGHSRTITKGTTSFVVNIKAGTYNFYCSVPGHEAAGMHGTLIVS
jgi:uncharacterized cupredoxin-like copper-binding protein